MTLADWQIQKLALEEDMIKGFDPERLNSYGYDLTLAGEFKIPDLMEQQVVDPFSPPPFREREEEEFLLLPPHSFVLGRSVEKMKMPRNVTGVCMGRSTYARAGIITNVTPLEAGWEGTVTIEISNTNIIPTLVRVGEGITQVLFFQGEFMPEKDYVQKGGRYQDQVGVTQGRPLHE
ncbi:hypothetical protein LCGC14_0918870 [marine sediment metagenome]|uniref:Uncharacterized protein n=1 Tax=marine sediment metagenome TaxID=412755 RepID=A0A0F9RA36_9ZZZZ